MRAIVLGSCVMLALSLPISTPALAKSLRACNADYAAAKAAGQAPPARSDFIAGCRAQPAGAKANGSLAANPGRDNGLRKPTAAEVEMERTLKRDMNICIGC